MANPRHNKQTTNRRGAMGGGMMKRTGYKSGSLKILQSLGLDEKILALDSDTLTNFSFLKEDLIITKVDLLFPKIDKKIS